MWCPSLPIAHLARGTIVAVAIHAVLAAHAAVADEPDSGDCLQTHWRGSGPGAVEASRDPFACAGAPRWEQASDFGNALSSQDDVCYPLFSEVADDFVATGEDILSLGWWGTGWCGSYLSPDGFQIRIYAVDEARTPTDLVHEVQVTDFAETMYRSRSFEWVGYCVDLPEPVPTLEHTPYAVSIVAYSCLPPQWGIWSSDQGNGTMGWFRSEFFGYPDWIPADELVFEPWEAAFVVNVDGAVVPTDGVTWAGMKSAFGPRGR